MGRLAEGLRRGEARGRHHGDSWFVRLGGARAPRRWFFHKAVRFVELYPTKKAARELKEISVDWTRLTLSFSIRDEAQRHALLREAVRRGWTIPHFRFEAQQRFRSPRRGVGGRHPHDPGRWGPEVYLREMERLSRRLLEFHDQAWKGVTAAEWRRFVSDCHGPERDRLVGLLESVRGAVADLAAAGDAMRGQLTGPRGRIKPT